MAGQLNLMQQQNNHHLCIRDEQLHSVTSIAESYNESREMDLSPLSTVGHSAPNPSMLSMNNLLESCKKAEIKSVPVLLGGKEVDLVRLFAEVMTHGGYEKCTEMARWSMVSANLGFGETCGAGLKLVYVKYFGKPASFSCTLNSPVILVDQYSSKSAEESSTGIDSDAAGSSDCVSPDSCNHHHVNGDKYPATQKRVSCPQNKNSSCSSASECRMPASKGTDIFVGVIDWVKRLALNPGDPKKGQGPSGSSQNEFWVESCSSLVKKVRKVLWGRKERMHCGSSWNKQKIPPALYYKELPKPNRRALERLRANQARALKCGLQLPGNPRDFHLSSLPVLCQSPKQSGGQSSEESEYSSAYIKSMTEALVLGTFLNKNATRKRIPIGPHFQVEVPEWTCKATSSYRETDTKASTIKSLNDADGCYGGSLVWPPRKSLKLTEGDKFVGRGRPSTCVCVNHMSIECVKQHVLEERERIQKELGEIFTYWGFNDMGEMVSGRWTKDEELIFDRTVKMNPLSLGKNFWEELPGVLPMKTIPELVSYYFNVFVVRRRAIENRTIPESIDSDDDEKELQTSSGHSTFTETISRKDADNQDIFLPVSCPEASNSDLCT